MTPDKVAFVAEFYKRTLDDAETHAVMRHQLLDGRQLLAVVEAPFEQVFEHLLRQRTGKGLARPHVFRTARVYARPAPGMQFLLKSEMADCLAHRNPRHARFPGKNIGGGDPFALGPAVGAKMPLHECNGRIDGRAGISTGFFHFKPS
jgi:hypothetical protein